MVHFIILDLILAINIRCYNWENDITAKYTHVTYELWYKFNV